MINIKKYRDTETFRIEINKKSPALKLATINPISTSATFRVFEGGYVSIDFYTGLRYVDDSFLHKNTSVVLDGRYLRISFTSSNKDKDVLDKFEGEDIAYQDKIIMYLRDWEITEILIHKSLLDSQLKTEMISFEYL